MSSMWPCQPARQPEQLREPVHHVTSSSSVAAGDESHVIALTFSAAISSSARMPGSEPVFANHAKKRGWFQCVIPGRITSSRSRSIASNGSPCSGGDSGRRARISPGLDLRGDGQLADATQVVLDPVGREIEIVPERQRFFLSFSICFHVRVLTTSSFVSHARRAWPTPSST